MRKLIAEEFPQGPISKVNEKRLNADLESLTRLAGNVYGQAYPRRFATSTSSGLSKEDLALVTSTAAYEILAKEIQSESRLERLKRS